MQLKCAICGFAADSVQQLPEEWHQQFIEQANIESSGPDGLQVPLCLGCQDEMERYLDPRYPKGGPEPDAAVKEFLGGIEESRIIDQ